ncbi:MAG: hypothetical protein JO021_23600 [Alphaproteobacteria bacterium]|nr:hypothetical protein [Alphaproteobacteria bacterium]
MRFDLQALRTRVTWSLFHRRSLRQNVVNSRFDAAHGTDTGPEIALTAAGVPEDQAARGNTVYRAVWESAFHDALRALPADLTGFTFVDYGSGKGKALLMASEYPFRRIVGIEYAPLLHQTALRNIAVYRSPTQRCRDIVSIEQDALGFEPPDGPLVCFFFNPFDAPTLRATLYRLRAAALHPVRPVYVVYVNLRDVDEMAPVFEGMGFFLPVARTRRHLILASPGALRAPQLG